MDFLLCGESAPVSPALFKSQLKYILVKFDAGEKEGLKLSQVLKGLWAQVFKAPPAAVEPWRINWQRVMGQNSLPTLGASAPWPSNSLADRPNLRIDKLFLQKARQQIFESLTRKAETILKRKNLKIFIYQTSKLIIKLCQLRLCRVRQNDQWDKIRGKDIPEK